jgi:hypothetical protein
MRLHSTKINKWKNLVDAFLKQYKFNLKTAPNKTSIMAMKKGNQEFMKSYAQR